MSSPLVEEGLAALGGGDAATARRAFELAVAEVESGEALEGLGEALYLEREYAASGARYERACSAYRAERQIMAAGRAARAVAWITGNVLGEWAVRSGWFARAQAILEEAGEGRPEHGWVLIIKAWVEPDAEALKELAIMDLILCRFFWACELVNDVPRADQWMRAVAGLMERRNVVAAFCRAHYGGILTAAGRWTEAETELLEAAHHFDQGLSSRREEAIIRLADLRIRQGRVEETAQLDGLEQHPDAVRTLADLHLARGDTAIARDLLERVTQAADDTVPAVGESTMVGPLLALLVDVYLEEGNLDDAERVARRLGRIAETQRGPYLRAAAALAKGRVCIATGNGDARACLHEALEGFARAQLPMELARTHLEMARALSERSPEVAIAEAKAALEAFERLEAARHADAAGALLRSLGAPVRTGPKGVGALTRREAEVLQLIGAGLSNPEIGDRLYITRKTVEHHVGNILSKLGLRNRVEAAAFATRQRPARN
jgi:DNA-binding NarL/FixJ family response regulator